LGRGRQKEQKNLNIKKAPALPELLFYRKKDTISISGPKEILICSPGLTEKNSPSK
jgi:hypothetical protein